jgi:hypothetical protein
MASNKRKPYWWQGDARECFWCEITDREDIGADLLCPQADEAGRAYWSYSLINEIRPTDIVFHYSTRDKAFVGASAAVGTANETKIQWTPHGTVGRSKAEGRDFRPAWSLPLARFCISPTPLTLAKIQQDQEWVRNWLEAKKTTAGTVYAPFQPYPDRLRGYQGYLTKMPADFVDRWAALKNLVSHLTAQTDGRDSISSLIDRAGADEAIIAVAEQLKSRSSGQGFTISPRLRQALEQYSMQFAVKYYSDLGYTVRVVGKPFDLECSRRGETLYVEVKGTQTAGCEILLSPNEVEFAKLHKAQMSLFVVHDVCASIRPDQTIFVEGGRIALYEPWDINSGELTPLGYTLRIAQAKRTIPT